MSEPAGLHIAVRTAAETEPVPPNLASALARFGSVELEYYVPKGRDPQTPHSRDEIYVIARGRAVLTVNGTTFECESGDVCFVAAHAEHRFSKFSDDFATWVIFYGPGGGEREAT